MNQRFMRVIVFFDLPVITSENRKNYRRFRKKLIMNGFYMLQKSVYCRMLINDVAAQSAVREIESQKPPAGNISVMTITEKQFAGITYISGESVSDVITTRENLLIL